MSLKLRRGTNAQRIVITPAEGELIYTTDTKKLYVGDGSTGGGVAVDTSGSALTDIVQDTSPQLGGNLDLNGHSIISTSNNDIIISPDGTGALLLNSGDVVIGSNSKSGKLTIVNSDNAINSFQYFYCGANITDPSDGSNFVFRRSRGTFNSPTVVQTNDDIVDMFFQAYDGTAYRTMAKIGAVVAGSVSNNLVPGSLTFSVHDTTTPGTAGLNEILELTTDGFLKTNKITSKTTNSNLELTANGTGKITLSNLSWPSADGSNGQVLTTNGSGTLSWNNINFSRSTVSGITGSISTGVTADLNITSSSKGYLLYKITVSNPAWVRIYASTAARTADASRSEGVSPAAGSGVIAEVVTTSINQTVLFSPGLIGFNNESPPVSTIYLKVTNKDLATTTIESTLTILSLES